ncbi:MAG: serine hydrolase [Sphingomonadales bacterium]|nr:serine hydrolase [Sphingomonadales bacterium]
MLTRRASLILPLLVLPALIGCGPQRGTLPPLDPAALKVVVQQPGVPRESLARAVDALFTDEEAQETRALLVVYAGRVVAERYAAPYHENTRFVSWSMAKSITGVMIGLLVADGRLRLDESVPVPAWQRPGDSRGEITLRQLLQMRSGLRHREEADPVYDADTVRMLFLDGRDDMAAFAEAQPLETEAGRKFKYSSATSVILADLAARSLTDSTDPHFRRQAVADYLRTRLFEPVGMKSMVPEFDAAGTLIGSSLIHGTARDWAKFGEFLRNGGAVKGAQVIPRAWIDFMTQSSPRNPGYGAQLWLNHPQVDDGQLRFPGAPQNAFAAIGHLGQYVFVSPSQKLTIVRLGKTEEAHRGTVVRRMMAVAALFPRSE